MTPFRRDPFKHERLSVRQRYALQQFDQAGVWLAIGFEGKFCWRWHYGYHPWHARKTPLKRTVTSLVRRGLLEFHADLGARGGYYLSVKGAFLAGDRPDA